MNDIAIATQLVAAAALIKHSGYTTLEAYKKVGIDRMGLKAWAKHYYNKTPAELIAEINQGKRRTANRIGNQHTLLKLSNRTKRALARNVLDDHHIITDNVPEIAGDVFMVTSKGDAEIIGPSIAETPALVTSNSITVIGMLIDTVLNSAAEANGKRS